jgi:DNA gyrase/topoisomerase IV subunit A
LNSSNSFSVSKDVSFWSLISKIAFNEFLLFRREIIIKRTTFDRLSSVNVPGEIILTTSLLSGPCFNVAVCEQIETAEEAKIKLKKGPLRREVVRIISPGTLTEDNLSKVVLLIIISLLKRRNSLKAILDMRLQKLTSLETEKLLEEFNELQKQIIYYNKILEDYDLQSSIIKEELLDIDTKYKDERKTEIIPISGDLTIEDMIADEDMVLTISHNGYCV